jgi:peroxin-6
MLKAVTRQATAVDAKVRELNESRSSDHHQQPISTAYFFDHYATPDDVAVTVTEADFLGARDELVPSVSAGELAHYEKVRAAFEGTGQKEQQGRVAESRPRIGAGAGGSGPLTRRTTSSSTTSSSKGKASSKGKGKAVATARWGSDEGDEEEDEVVERPSSSGHVNGRSSNKGKGKAVAPPVFADGTGSGDDGLYD